MVLTLAQQAVINKARALGGGKLGVALSDQVCAYLVAIIAQDLQLLGHFPEFGKNLPPFFGAGLLERLALPGHSFMQLFERLVTLDPNTDTYFSCLATLHKSRLKYERILRTQPLPAFDQVGPRSLLQYGMFSPLALAGFIFWRKWMFDIDNRAAQETGYLFEPIIAHAIGGTPASSAKSPVFRAGDTTRGRRQVDCIRDDKAYEIKIRVTTAASGQGRWHEELEFPFDCSASGYSPVLIVLDSTRNEKLDELESAFNAQDGEVYIGPDAWTYLEGLAGNTMARFLAKYVHEPIQALLSEAPNGQDLPELVLRMSEEQFALSIAGETFAIERAPSAQEYADIVPLRNDADEMLPSS